MSFEYQCLCYTGPSTECHSVAINLLLLFLNSSGNKVFTFVFWDLNFPYFFYFVSSGLGCHTSLTAHISSRYHTHTQFSLTILGAWLHRPPWAEAQRILIQSWLRILTQSRAGRYDLGKVMLEDKYSIDFDFVVSSPKCNGMVLFDLVTLFL